MDVSHLGVRSGVVRISGKGKSFDATFDSNSDVLLVGDRFSFWSDADGRRRIGHGDNQRD
jgi:hypothetical protein